ncbi:MAG: tRNA threonylcarbamoyladenosine biosynthesis protein TsaE [Micromonosporaceae bacterium]|nr:tRNA threonylcarbamoyladenosine biosynthesis protein TsaE [Micromonosporaceae bacterium]MDT5039006.1 tRNA threonylcarbamoyladenosine biosynthesis protein TsaE [Micromonosporaceae bacterium]
MVDCFTVTVDGPGQTGQVAAALAARLVPGDVVLLSGGLAAGKTTFVKAVAAALGAADLVTSPTFALAQFYPSGRTPILHVDTYRLGGIAEYRDLGLDEYTHAAVCLVEWGELVAGEFGCHLAVRLRPDPPGTDRRAVTFTSACDRWSAVLDVLHRDILKDLS